ncbi:hypothetical protein UFOVP898_13 [uncultured Caudovirales phage]|uniref:Uncharacterized protein n=1 Tax=uncultured Caudovirales phage TaxID=2100421 RepID=A0A6J5S9Y8_9CAUD|nr:hypothetical protein UFOVP898_13 [uncultured Caudovirales phage]CAB4176638.1 hypothetical protein UFOVP985_46 [uncultured Caudovirales phage]CAB4181116.1 hypothetical protein UFOVP1073_11 [uncultured Caudovirales phage]CAB4198106.1 hypothetical protein UFOVP1308_50 [uncultured Caudovirales phage]CAB4210446.1 hypothetical protein UFOVP1423_19 [uncultured Caudovirales phage]
MRPTFLVPLAFFLAVLFGEASLPAGEVGNVYLPAGQVVVDYGSSDCVGGVCSTVPVHAAPPQRAPRRVVVHQHNDITVVNGSAQADAEAMAARGVLRHQGNNRGCREGIGYSTQSADDAIRRCCFYGRYRAREIGVARGSRGYYACIRYE